MLSDIINIVKCLFNKTSSFASDGVYSKIDVKYEHFTFTIYCNFWILWHTKSEYGQSVCLTRWVVVRKPILTFCGSTPLVKGKSMIIYQCIHLKKAQRHMYLSRIKKIIDMFEVNLHVSNFSRVKYSINHKENLLIR